MMKILFLGANSGTSLHRANALRRNGHEVQIIYPDSCMAGKGLASKFHYETGALFCQSSVEAWVLSEIGDEGFDLVWVDSGRYIGPRLIQQLRQEFGPVLNYHVDDPYGRRDRFSWSLYRRSVSHYDLVAVVRLVNVAEAKQLGARRALRVFRSADEVAHQPRVVNASDLANWNSDVTFIGTWMPERGPFMVRLLELGVPLSIRGDFWQKAPEWPQLTQVWRSGGINNDDDYAKSIQCAKVCLGLLSKENRDLHTTRSMEIPYLGGLLCAERTTEHLQLYKEGSEAIFWSDADECAQKCLELLENEPLRSSIAHQGRLRCIENGTLNQVVTSQVIDAVFKE